LKKHNDFSQIFIIDTSALLSGKPLPIDQDECWTVEEIAEEFTEGGPSYRMFSYLCEKGLSLHRPSKKALDKVRSIVRRMGETYRLSTADQMVLALAFDVQQMENKKAIIITDDYSIQNIASVLKIQFQAVSQKGITKTFKWMRRCRGCGRKLTPEESICPICGSEARFVVDKHTKK
jgi:UPF0271 protein